MNERDLTDYYQVDAQVSSIQPNGFFVTIGPMAAFIGRAVGLYRPLRLQHAEQS